MSFILADGRLITMNDRREILESGSVCVQHDRIAAVGTRQQLQQRYPEAEAVDCTGRIVMPGMVNTHTHLFQTLLKGLGDDMVLKKWFTCMTGPSAVTLPPGTPTLPRFMAALSPFGPGSPPWLTSCMSTPSLA